MDMKTSNVKMATAGRRYKDVKAVAVERKCLDDDKGRKVVNLAIKRFHFFLPILKGTVTIRLFSPCCHIIVLIRTIKLFIRPMCHDVTRLFSVGCNKGDYRQLIRDGDGASVQQANVMRD